MLLGSDRVIQRSKSGGPSNPAGSMANFIKNVFDYRCFGLKHSCQALLTHFLPFLIHFHPLLDNSTKKSRLMLWQAPIRINRFADRLRKGLCHQAPAQPKFL